MANWYYYNESGDKIEVTGGQLKGLAKAGTITPDTIVETEDGKKARAGKVKGLKFAESESTPESVTQDTALPGKPNAFNLATAIPIPPTSQPAPTATTTPGTFCTYCGQPVQPTAAACTACGADPRVHRKFCYACGTPVNEVQVICTKCHTPIAGAGSVPVGQTPGQTAAPMQPVTQPQPGATAQLVIEVPEKLVCGGIFDVLIDGKTMGQITADKQGRIISERNMEISVPLGWIKLEIVSTGGRLIMPVTIDFTTGQKKKIVIHPKKFHWLSFSIMLVFCIILVVVMVLVGGIMFGELGLIVGSVLGVFLTGVTIALYGMSTPPNVIEIEG